MKLIDEDRRSLLPDGPALQGVVIDRFEFHHDESIPASKWRGYDAAGELCWYRHSFELWHESFDDEDQPCLRHAGSELLEARRCADGGWLRRKIVIPADGPCAGRIDDSGVEQITAAEAPDM